jgi:hypothetical protein
MVQPSPKSQRKHNNTEKRVIKRITFLFKKLILSGFVYFHLIIFKWGFKIRKVIFEIKKPTSRAGNRFLTIIIFEKLNL